MTAPSITDSPAQQAVAANTVQYRQEDFLRDWRH